MSRKLKDDEIDRSNTLPPIETAMIEIPKDRKYRNQIISQALFGSTLTHTDDSPPTYQPKVYDVENTSSAQSENPTYELPAPQSPTSKQIPPHSHRLSELSGETRGAELDTPHLSEANGE
jgi:hypothetical protein